MDHMDCHGLNDWGVMGIKRLLLLLLSLLAMQGAYAEEAVCAKVKIEIQQELTLERQAFDAMMRINNGLETLAIENVNVTVNFADENGAPVLATSNPNETNPDAKFFIRIDTMDGIADVSGYGVVAPGTSGEIHWLIIPIPGAAEGAPGGKLYYVGAHLSYTLGGEPEEVDVTPDFITVKPLPKLALDYFLTRDVVADDAFTPEVEPPQPFTLGLRINNKGTGPANNVAIDSGQPKIVENEQGLLIGFTITGSSLDDAPATPDLKLNFGNIGPAESRVGRWIMESTLSGQFTDFSATVCHADELGGAVTSLIDTNDINTHNLLRDVRVDLPGRDRVRDFLAYPVNGTLGTLTVYESDTVDSAVSNLSASATLELNSVSGTESYYTLTVPVQAGFVYARLADPFNGEMAIKSVVRSDGKVISPDNAWNSRTRNRNTTPPSWEHWLNLFDVNSTGTYIVHIGQADQPQVPPVLQFINDQVSAEGKQVGFLVQASDPNGDAISLSATPLPAGASFMDNGDGTAYFNWTPSVGQAGLYSITYKASDGTLSATRSATIKVNPAWDTDGDGLDDAWELEHFGNLDRDGSGDADGDGISDLDEYLNGTDPNLPPPAVPTGILAFSGNAQSTLLWPAVDGADSYRIYWATEPGVSKQSGAVLDTDTSPFTHSGLTNGTTYYYVLTSVGRGGESATSAEISVVPGRFDWGVPGMIEQGSGDVYDLDAAVAADGSSLVVWTQSDGMRTNLWGNRYLPGSGWGEPVVIDVSDSADVSKPRLAIDPDGYAMVLWRESDGLADQLWVADFSPALGWGTPASLSSAASLGDARLVIRTDGSVVAVWSQGDVAGTDGTVWSASYVAGAWGSASRIESGTALNTASLQLAADASGNMLAVWSATADGQSYDLVYNRLDAAAGWGSAQVMRSGLLGDTTAPVVTAQLAMNSAGEAVLVWGESASPNSIWASRYSAAGGWETAAVLDSSDTVGAYMPTVAIDEAGNAITAWAQSDGTSEVLYATRYAAGTGWDGVPVVLSVASRPSHPGNVSAPVLKMSDEGNAILSWQQGDGVQSNIWSRRYELSSTSWQPPQIIETENAGDAITPLIAMNGSGDTLVAWRQSDGQHSNLWANTFASGNDGMPNITPVVVVPGTLSVDEQTSVALTVSDAFDQDGTVVSYEWGQVSGSSVALTNADSANASFTAPTLVTAEALTFVVKVTDDQGGITEKLVQVTVNPVNALPVANAGADQSIDEQTQVSVTATVSDSDGSVVSTSWTQVSGPQVTMSGADSASMSFTAPAVKQAEDLVFRVTVTDNEGGVASDEVTITVNPVNHAPVVNAGTDQTVDEQIVVTLAGQASDPDADGVLVSYAWSQLSGTPVALNGGNSLTASFTAPTLKQAEVLSFRLSVTDDEGGVSTDDVSVTVNPVNHVPVVNAGADQFVDEQSAVSLIGTASDPDADGLLVSYSWSQLAGTPVSLTGADSLNAGFQAPTLKQAAVLTFRLTVTDDEGGVSSDEVQVTVNPVNHVPVVDAGTDQVVDEQTVVTLTGSASDPDADGILESYQWSQVGGTAVQINNADSTTATFTAPTLKQAVTLTLRLTVTDDEGGVAYDDISVMVNPVNHPPVANAEEDKNAAENTQVTLAVTATDPDDDGLIASYLWTQTGGPAVNLSNATTDTASFMAPAVYQDTLLSFRAVVTDDEGGVAFDTLNVTLYSTNPDDDADGMDDLWEIAYFGDLSHDGTADSDGDGATDLMEFQFGSDPAVPQGPGEPAISSPDASEVTALQPQLVVVNGEHHPDFTVTYQFEVYSDAAMTQLVGRAQSVSERQGTTAWTVDTPLADNTRYYWRARADGWVLFSGWVSSSFFVNTANDAPATFNISSPQDGVWVDSFTPLLSVTNSHDVDEDVLTYAFEVFPYGDTSSPLSTASGLAEGAGGSTAWLMDTPLMENTWYTWGAMVTDEHGAQTLSEQASFFVNTVNDAPTVPQIQNPQDGAEISTLDAQLVVANAYDPDSPTLSYTIELDTVNTFDSPNLTAHTNVPEGTGSTSLYVTGLRDNTWYYWRAKASDGMAQSAWAQGRFFVNTANDAPTVPVHENPGDGAWVGTLTPALALYPSTDVDFDRLSYEFEVYAADRRKRLDSMVSTGLSDTTYWQLQSALPEPGWYFWRARAIDEHDAMSDWSEMTIFYADNDGVNDAPSMQLKKVVEVKGGHEDDDHRQNGCRQGHEHGHDKSEGCIRNKFAHIRWHDRDPDSNATISLYYDSDSQGADGVLIAGAIEEDPDGRYDGYLWDITALPPGIYFVYGVIDDGTSQQVSYAPGAMIVGDGGGRPYIEMKDPDSEQIVGHKKLQLRWDDLDSDSNAMIALYYDTDQQGRDGTLIVSGILEDPDGKEDSYQWNISAVPEGNYYLYAVIQDEKEQFVAYAEEPVSIGNDRQKGHGSDKKDDSRKRNNDKVDKEKTSGKKEGDDEGLLDIIEKWYKKYLH
jgi:hypothetical protein